MEPKPSKSTAPVRLEALVPCLGLSRQEEVVQVHSVQQIRDYHDSKTHGNPWDWMGHFSMGFPCKLFQSHGWSGILLMKQPILLAYSCCLPSSICPALPRNKGQTGQSLHLKRSFLDPQNSPSFQPNRSAAHSPATRREFSRGTLRSWACSAPLGQQCATAACGIQNPGG